MNVDMRRSNFQLSVDKFMLEAQQAVPTQYTHLDSQTRRLRATLILEEALETIKALGFSVDCPQYTDGVFIDEEMYRYNPIETIDGCADIMVVTAGTLTAMGVPDLPILTEVQRSNLDKFGEGSYRRDDGKWIKPPNHKKPELEKVLKSLDIGY